MHAILRLFLAVGLIAGFASVPTLTFASGDPAPALLATYKDKKASKSTADHSKFKELKGPFATGPDVTVACLKCHTEASKQLHKTKHWQWEVVNPKTGQKLGKKNVVNNFCGSITTNEPRCTSCHIGYGWKDQEFDFAREDRVDCLVCHDNTGKYKKYPAGAGHPPYEKSEWPKGSGKFMMPPDLASIAQGVGKTTRQNCGTCHFSGGGGNAVKHGDLDYSLLNPGPYLDVHMSKKGKALDFSCAQCHNSDAHAVKGSRYFMAATDDKGIDIPGRDDGNRSTCQSCHGNHPMKTDKANDHTDKLACQSCHVPSFARGGYATKMWWDWSNAGKLTEDGKTLVKKNEKGEQIYHSFKGDFEWGQFVTPEYQWYGGTMMYTMTDTQIDPDKVVKINDYQGAENDPGARIWPFKVMRGKQVYDKVNKTLGVVHLFGKDPAAYWGNYDWDKALTVGMAAAGRPYSGEYGFVETEMRWPITHMVAPQEDTVPCKECHTKGGRLENVPGVYIPGRDSIPMLDFFGYITILLTFVGVLFHGALRMYFHYKSEE